MLIVTLGMACSKSTFLRRPYTFILHSLAGLLGEVFLHSVVVVE